MNADIMSVRQRLDAVAPQLSAIRDNFNHGGADVAVVKLRDRACKILKDAGLVYSMQMHSMYVGVHPRNRYGKGIVPHRVHDLLDGIAGNWSDAELSEPWSSEVPPAGHIREAEFKQYNQRMTEDSAGLLPCYPEGCGQMKIVSARCGHTSQTLRCVWHEVPSSVERLCEEGNLNIRNLRKIDSDYADCVEKGLTWNIIRWEVEDEFPFLMDLVQEAGNASQALAQCESRTEIMMKLHGVAARLFADEDNLRNADETWDKVLSEALRGKPAFAEEVPDLLKFIKSLSGGLGSPTYLLALRDFQRSLKQPATVKGWLYASLAETNVGKVYAAAPDFRVACIKAAMCTDKVYPNGDQKLIQQADVVAVKDRLAALAKEANGIIVKVREIAGPFLNGPLKMLVTSIVQITEIRCVNHVLRKMDPIRGSFKSLHDIGFQCVQDLSTAMNVAIESPWQPSKLETPNEAAKAPAGSAGITVFSSTGSVANALELVTAQGFVQGNNAVRHCDGVVFKITNVCSDRATLEDEAGVQCDVFHEAFLQGQYHARAPQRGISLLTGWQTNSDPTEFFDMRCELASSTIRLALAEEYQKHKKVNEKLEIVSGPASQKGLRATGSFVWCSLRPSLTLSVAPYSAAANIG